MKEDKTTEAFFALVKAGLWEQDVQLAPFKGFDFNQVYRLAEEQAVFGLVAAGLEHVVDVKLPKEGVLQFVSQALQLEQQNQAMNAFIGKLVDKMRIAGIYTLLVKGQGVAQSYDRPLWRSCGDVDFFLSKNNYELAKVFLTPLAGSSKIEGKYKQEYSLVIDPWVVELHGNMRCGLSARMDRVIDEIQRDIFYGSNVRSWMNEKTQVFLPGINCDICFVFTHFLKHFYCGGIGLRQICDWCRLLWTYRDSLNHELLESRIRKMGLMSEWKAFGAFAVKYLGMSKEAMPLYNYSAKWQRKADRICKFVMEVGNFGHNRDNSYFEKYSYVIRKAVSLGRRCKDLARHARIFPLDSLRFFPSIMFNGLRSAARGE